MQLVTIGLGNAFSTSTTIIGIIDQKYRVQIARAYSIFRQIDIEAGD